MAEDFGDKTEAPTPKRRQEAREQGNIARSTDLSAAVLIIGIMLLLDWYGPNLMQTLAALMAQMLGQALRVDQGTDGISVTIFASLRSVIIAMAPLLLGVMLIAISINVAQVGLMFNSKRLKPNLNALNPMKGIQKLLGGGHGFVQLLMNITKLVLVALVAYSAVHGRLVEIIAVQQLSFQQIFAMGASIVYSIMMRIGILLLVLALIDYAYQRFRNERQLRMTKHEVKEEMRRMEGDPKIKQRRRQIAMQMATQRFRRDVPEADVVVTNPTEFAVAIKYDADTMNAPRVVAKGQGYLAMKIREIAIAAGVPILERKPLARALYKLVDVGQEIPEQFYSAVAEILAYVYELSGKLREKQAV
jgi:flagellar biosynthesis protein FlhB